MTISPITAETARDNPRWGVPMAAGGRDLPGVMFTCQRRAG